MLRDGRHSESHVCEREILRDDRAPARGSKFDWCCQIFLAGYKCSPHPIANRIHVSPAKYCSVACKSQPNGILGNRERVTGLEELLTDKFIVLVTCSTAAEARRIARAAVEARLAACVNILPGVVQSIYRWKGKVESARERLLLIKTSRKCLAKLRAAVERLHSYDVPEFIAIPIAQGSPAYLAWLEECLERSPHGKN